jgi:hypothetical protein
MRHQKPIDDQIEALMTVLATVAPDNIAPIPVAIWQEDGKWSVEVHVRVRRVTEYEVCGTGATLSDALANARRALANENTNVRQASINAETFGFTF